MASTIQASVALKEWALTGAALGLGRQIILLRKGGLLDEDGTFHLEHRSFLLLPTWLHQEPALVSPEHRDLFELTPRGTGENARHVIFRHFATVECVWALGEEDAEKVERTPMIWSRRYLDLRFGYKPEKPLLCAALRAWTLVESVTYHLAPEQMGCRSWVELAEPVVAEAEPVLSDEEFLIKLEQLKSLFG